MNIQAMMKQAQAMQKDMLKIKDEVDNTEFTGESSLVKVTVKGTKEVVKVEIDAKDGLDSDDVEMLEDLIVAATNEALRKIDDASQQSMSKITGGLGGGMF